MEKEHKNCLLDQVFDAIDGQNFCKARYRLTEALDAAKSSKMVVEGCAPNSSPEVEGQA